MKRILIGMFASTIFLVGHSFGQTTFYVAPGGNDSYTDAQGQHPGTPFKTPNRVQTAIHDLGACATRGAVTVYFKTSAYYLGNSTTNPTGTWTISGTDTCSASPITYSNWVVGGVAQDAGIPILSGGIQLGNGLGTWTQHTTSSGATLWSIGGIPLSPTGSFSPEALYYHVKGAAGVPTRRFRTRSSATSGNLIGAFPLVGSAEPNGRIPSQATTYYDRFTYVNGDWPDQVATASNYAGWNPNAQSSSPCTGTTEPTYGGDIEVLVFEKWTMSRERISCIDTTAKVVYLLGSTVGSSDHGYIPGHRYFIENYISRDSNHLPILFPGQFFIDRANQTLYYMPNSGETPSQDSVVLPVLSGTTSGALLAASSIQYVTFQGLTFEDDNYAPPQSGYASVQSDTGLSSMVTCLDCSNTSWTGNMFTQTIGHALAFQTDQSSATPLHNAIDGNYFYDLGSDGILYGGLPKSGDTGTNILGNGQIESNLVQGFGRMYAGSSGIENPFGYNTTIVNNDVNDGYQTGIGVCIPNPSVNCATGSGGSAYGVHVNYDHVWNIGKGVTDDMGAVYVASLSAGSSSNRNQVLNNWLHDVNDAQVLDSDGYGGNGIYLDSTTGNIDVENNLVYRVTSHTYQNTQGTPSSADPNYVNNNIFSYGRVALLYEGSPTTGTPTYLTTTLSNNIFYFDGNGSRGSSCESLEQDTKFCTFTIQADCTVLQTSSAPVSFSSAAQQYSENIYYNPYSGNSGWASTGAFFTVNSPVPSGNTCPKFSTYTFTNWQNTTTPTKQDAGSFVYNSSNTNPFKHPYCSDSTPDACLNDTTKQDDYSQASGFTVPTGFVFFNAGLAGRQGTTYPLCPTYAPCPGTVSDTFPPTTFSLQSTTTNTLTSY